jgi:hypothetical protein
MPYIVTTKRHRGSFYPPHPNVATERRAVTALEIDPLADVLRPLLRHDLKALEWVDMMNELTALPVTGGVVGPLPDGSVIEVELVDVMRLWREAGEPDTTRTEAIIVAWNAIQEKKSLAV